METGCIQYGGSTVNKTKCSSGLVSIIIPVYNVEEYLPKCIESICSQTYLNWELILVNDGSKDASGEICDQYAQKDARIKVVHKHNAGVSSARNRGMELAKGEYICFIDSDDYVDATFLDDFQTKQYVTDFYISGAYYDVHGKPYSCVKYKEQFCESINQIRDTFFSQQLYSNGYPWGKLYRSKIIKDNHLVFDESLSIHEDHNFVFAYFALAKSVFVTSSAGYHYLVFETFGRKLSSKSQTYKQLIMASDLFRKNVDVLKDKWRLSKDEYMLLIRGFVYSTRLRALRPLVLNKEMRYLSVETRYWQCAEYEGISKKDRLTLSLLRSSFPFKRIWLYILFLAMNLRIYTAYEKLIYKDLESRSVRL